MPISHIIIWMVVRFMYLKVGSLGALFIVERVYYKFIIRINIHLNLMEIEETLAAQLHTQSEQQ